MDVDMIDPALSAESDQAAGDKLSTSAHTLSPQSTRKVVPTKIEEDEDSDDASDPDPIIGRFKILNKTTHSDNRTLTILEHTNKSDGKKPPRQPLELRAKPTTGMLELDLPVDYSSHYDRSKGLNWGAQLHKSTESKKGGSHGLAGGFGVGAPPPRASRGRGAAANAEDEILDMGMDWTEALRKDYVLRTQTLGGQVPEKGGESNYLVAVFSKGALHIVPADSLIHLRPQLHHLDAASEQERLTRGGSGPGGAAGAGTAAGKEAARAIHMTIKQSGSGGDEDIIQETMADRLKKVQTENWRRHRYVHDEAADSWAVSEEALYLEEAVAEATAAEVEGKGKEPATAEGNDLGVSDLTEKVAALHTTWEEDSALETTSGIQKEKSVVKIEISDDEPKTAVAAKDKGKGKAVGGSTAPATRPTAGRASKPAADASSTTTANTAPTTRGKRANTTRPSSSQSNDGAASASAASVPKAGRTTRAKKNNTSSSKENNDDA